MFKRLRKYNLKLQPNKCEFLRKEVTFLKHKISERGVEPNTCKVDAVNDFLTPKTVKELKRFLVLISYYRKFIPQFSKTASPLHALLKKEAKYVWRDSQEMAFRTLKQRLLS